MLKIYLMFCIIFQIQRLISSAFCIVSRHCTLIFYKTNSKKGNIFSEI